MNTSFPDDGQWHRVVVERRGNRIADFRIYLDSVNVSSLDLQRDNLVTGDMNTGGLEAMRIGTRKYTNSNQEYNFTGDIKQVRIYNRALSSIEVEQSYAQGLFGTTANQNGLILWAPLDEGAGQQSKDESAYAEIGTHAGTGAAWKSELSTATCTTCPTTVLCTTTSSSEASAYRYGFNGKEKDSFGNTVYDYGFRIYNPEIAKFLTEDPLMKSYPMLTPYQFAGNSPIESIDIDGLERLRVGKDGNLEIFFPRDATSNLHNPAPAIKPKPKAPEITLVNTTFIGPDPSKGEGAGIYNYLRDEAMEAGEDK